MRLDLKFTLLLAASSALGAFPARADGQASPRPVPGAPGAGPGRVERRVGLMGTTLALEVEAASRERALAASEAAVRALEEAEARLSTWRATSELSRLNQAPVGERFALTPATRADLGAACRWARATGGAFDPAVGALVRAWGLREGGRRPDEQEIAAAIVPGGIAAALELGDGFAVRRAAVLAIEEGGFGKGAGLDAAARALRAEHADAALLDLGGQLLVLGRTRTVALADPDQRERPVLELVLDEGSFSTTGNSEHGLVVGGERVGHVLDPRTGRPSTDFGSIGVQARDATAADCLSTGFYVLGPERALELASDLAADGVEVVVLERTAGGLRARATRGLAGRLRAIDPALAIELSPTARPDAARSPVRKEEER